jgi:hypothetical protein
MNGIEPRLKLREYRIRSSADRNDRIFPVARAHPFKKKEKESE